MPGGGLKAGSVWEFIVMSKFSMQTDLHAR
jgi:hypothetical protein